MAIMAAVNVDDIFAVTVGLGSRCDRFHDELSHLVSIKKIGNFDGLEVITIRGIGRGVLGRYPRKRLPMSQ